MQIERVETEMNKPLSPKQARQIGKIEKRLNDIIEGKRYGVRLDCGNINKDIVFLYDTQCIRVDNAILTFRNDGALIATGRMTYNEGNEYFAKSGPCRACITLPSNEFIPIYSRYKLDQSMQPFIVYDCAQLYDNFKIGDKIHCNGECFMKWVDSPFEFRIIVPSTGQIKANGDIGD